MKFSFLLILLLLPLLPAAGQVSAPGLLDSQFSGTGGSAAMRLTLLQPFRGESDAPGIAWEGRDELTVHVNKGKQGLLEDLHANGSVLSVRVLLGHSAFAPRLLLRREQLGIGAVDNESGDALHFRSRFDQPEGRLTWPLRNGGQAYAGYRTSSYEANGTTRLYDNIFTVFPQTPPFQYREQERLALAGLSRPVSHWWSLEAVAGYKEEPSSFALSQAGSPVQIVLPLRDSGITSMVAVRRRLAPDRALFAYLGGERLSGTAAVEREGSRQIGEAVTTHREASWGVGWQRSFGERRSVGIFWETAQERWQTLGTVPNPGDLQTQYAFTSDLHYGGQYALTRHTLGLNWDQQDRHDRTWQGSVQFLTLKVNADAAYDVRFYGLRRAGQTTYSRNNLRAAAVRLGYTFPLHPLRIGLEVSQLIPFPGAKASHSGVSGTTGPADPNSRSTSGGWTLSLKVERLF